MKQIITLRNLLVASCIAATGFVNNAGAQSYTSHPLAFATSTAPNNFYRDYVGTRVLLTSPTADARSFAYTTSYNLGTGSWGADITAPMVDVPLYMPDGSSGNDSFACTGLTPNPGKIFVVWRGPEASACEFGAKALNAQTAGAVAVILINEYAGEGPVGMAAGASGGTVTIPVFMIGNLDGIALSALYHSSPAGTLKMTLTPWGKGAAHDLGFVPGGISVWNSCAVPAYQVAGTNLAAYKGLDGAFIANYGTSDMTNPVLTSSVTFTPAEGGATTTIHTNTVTFTNPIPGEDAHTFSVADSIFTMFGDEYDMTSSVTGKGTYNMTYTIAADIDDEAPADNSITQTYQLTDSVFSKGRYDFVKDQPIATLWTGPGGTPAPTDYLWGVPFFVPKGADAIKSISFSASGSAPGILPGGTTIQFFVFQWNDGTAGTGSMDSAMEGPEMTLLGAASKTFDGVADSAFGIFTTGAVTDDTTGAGTGPISWIHLPANSNIFIAAQMTGGLGMGCDGILDMYPRAYGRHHFHNFTETYNNIYVGATSGTGAYAQLRADMTTDIFFNYFGGGGATGGNVFDVDSTHYAGQYGLIPAISFKVTPWQNVGVKEQTPIASKFEVYPNPTTSNVNVALNLLATAKTVSYTIISSTAQLIATEKRTNVQNDVYTYSTSKLAPGNYYIVVNVDGHMMNKKFTVIK